MYAETWFNLRNMNNLRLFKRRLAMRDTERRNGIWQFCRQHYDELIHRRPQCVKMMWQCRSALLRQNDEATAEKDDLSRSSTKSWRIAEQLGERINESIDIASVVV
jgi:hypothetical protein